MRGRGEQLGVVKGSDSNKQAVVARVSGAVNQGNMESFKLSHSITLLIHSLRWPTCPYRSHETEPSQRHPED